MTPDPQHRGSHALEEAPSRLATSLPQLEALIAVVDEGSYTGAAEALQISQPSLSRRIRVLEDSLGIQLFVPAGRQMALTEAGRYAVGSARRVLDELQALAASVASDRALMTGSLRITGLPSLLATRVPDYVGAFHRAHPGVQINVSATDDTDQLVEAVRVGRADVAIGVHEWIPQDIAVVPLPAQEFVAVLPSDGESSDQVHDLDRAELADRTLVTLPRGTSIRAITESVYGAYRVRPPRVITSSQRDSLIRLALTSGAVTVVPRDLADAEILREGRIARLHSSAHRPIGALYRRDRLRSSALDSFIAVLEAAGHHIAP